MASAIWPSIASMVSRMRVTYSCRESFGISMSTTSWEGKVAAYPILPDGARTICHTRMHSLIVSELKSILAHKFAHFKPC